MGVCVVVVGVVPGIDEGSVPCVVSGLSVGVYVVGSVPCTAVVSGLSAVDFVGSLDEAVVKAVGRPGVASLDSKSHHYSTSEGSKNKWTPTNPLEGNVRRYGLV